MKACVVPPSRGSVRCPSRSFPGGAGLVTRGANERSAHLPRPLESQPTIDRFAKIRGVQQHDRNAARPGPPDRGANNPGRVALTAMVRLGEHREEIRGGRPAPTRPRLDIHDPYAAARDRLGADLDDEPSEATRTHAVASPSTVDRIRCVMITSREVRDRLPHQSTMADEKIERRYAAAVPLRPGLGWTSMIHTQPLATGSPPISTMNPTKRRERIRSRAHRR